MSEFDWIARYFAPLARGSGAAGLSDDVARLSGRADIVTVDALVEGVHFLSTDPIDTVARKLVRVNVSDIIAKGARPDEALLTLGWPKGRDEAELAGFAEAFGEELVHWGLSLIGGDTVTSPDGVFLSLTLTGKSLGADGPVRRNGARLGDVIWVSGEIGAGYKGLQDAVAGVASEAAQRYRVPDIPRLQMAGVIAAYATAGMDVSDGLIGDLQKLLKASGCGGILELDRVAIYRGHEPPTLEGVLACCTGGDDYQCLFTAPKNAREAILGSGLRLTPIGRVVSGIELGLTWHGEAVKMPLRTGFVH